jgi:acid phosphatase type 7
MTLPLSPPATALYPDCVELGVWTPIPQTPPADLVLHLKQIAAEVSQAIKDRQTMSFHAVGCTGCHADQQATMHVAQAMALQAVHPHHFGGTPVAVPVAFLYHLGDVVYKKDKETAGDQSPPPPLEQGKDFGELYDRQFYSPFASYGPLIFAVAGNHDGKDKDPDGPPRKSAIRHFLTNFCSLAASASDNQSSNRPAMRQPYPYWVLKTPLVLLQG